MLYKFKIVLLYIDINKWNKTMSSIIDKHPKIDFFPIQITYSVNIVKSCNLQLWKSNLQQSGLLYTIYIGIYYQRKFGVFYQSANIWNNIALIYTINVNSEYFINQLIKKIIDGQHPDCCRLDFQSCRLTIFTILTLTRIFGK